jgi:hypothetical protein
MSAQSLIQELSSRPVGESLDIAAIRERIYQEFDAASTSNERSMLLGVFAGTMDHAEKYLKGPDLIAFQTARMQDYKLLLIKECLVGENVCAETMLWVTAREVAAGRMEETHSLRQLALSASQAPHPSRAELFAELARKSAPAAPLSPLAKLKRLFGAK